MENTEEFESWLLRMLVDAKRKLLLNDATIAYVLLKRGTEYYLKQLAEDDKWDLKL